MRLPVDFLVEKYKDHIYAASFSICRNQQDAEDITQDTFLKYFRNGKEFADEEHIKAWLLRVAINQSKDVVRSFWFRNRTSLQDYMQTLSFQEPGDRNVLETILALPEKYRIVMHLFYFEGYECQEISQILKIRESSVRSRLSRGRKLLKEKLKEVWNENE